MLEAAERKATHQTPLLLLRNMLAKMYLAKYQGGAGKVPGSFGDSKPLGKQVYIPKGMDKGDIPFINQVEKSVLGKTETVHMSPLGPGLGISGPPLVTRAEDELSGK